MFVRTVTAKTTQGPTEYVQLCHNHYDPQTKRSKTQILYNFGRADALDVEAIRRLIRSLSRCLPPDEAAEIQTQLGEEPPIEFLGSRRLGGPWLLQGMWQRLGMSQVLADLLRQRAYQTDVERMIFAMVANRALAPASKLHLAHWVTEEAFIPDLATVEVHQLYRTMDFLLEAAEPLQRAVFHAVADLFNLEVDLLFLDTTTTYFEISEEDGDAAEGEEGLRKRSRESKDRRADLPQVVVGFAVTRTGIPIRSWVWPGNTSDQAVVQQVKRDLRGWRLGRVVLVEDAGFNSATNRRILQQAGGNFIIGERMRETRHATPVEALRRGGQYQVLESGLEVKEVITGGDSEARRRYVVARNPKEAERERAKREEIVAEVERRLDELNQLSGEPHKKETCELRAHPVYGRYLRQTKTGKLRLDKGKIREEAKFDGKFLVSTSDDGLSIEDVALGYKQLFEIERVFYDLKHLIDIRPVRHRLPERIRAHVLLCWLAMLLIRLAENETGQTWFQMKKILAGLQLGMHRAATGEIWQRNDLRKELKELYERLQIKPPPRYLKLPTPPKRNP